MRPPTTARRAVLSAALAGLVAAAAACGDDGGDAPPAAGGCRAATGGTVAIVADELAWDTDCLEVPAGAAVTIEIDNRDTGVNHNLRVDGLPGGDARTELEPGPVLQELEVTAPAGTYRFVCDIHPNMVGELVATDP